MSHEVLVGSFNLQISEKALKTGRRWVHDAAHDMESIMWVILHLCITHGPPGLLHRKELQSNDSPEGKEIKEKALFPFFENRDTQALGNKKAQIFSPAGKEILEKELLVHFHPFFKPLEPLVIALHDLLTLTFQFQAFEYDYIHDRVLAILNNAINKMQPAKVKSDQSGAVVERRQKDVDKLLRSYTNNGSTQLEQHSLNSTNTDWKTSQSFVTSSSQHFEI